MKFDMSPMPDGPLIDDRVEHPDAGEVPYWREEIERIIDGIEKSVAEQLGAPFPFVPREGRRAEVGFCRAWISHPRIKSMIEYFRGHGHVVEVREEGDGGVVVMCVIAAKGEGAMSENNDGLGDLPVGGVQPIPDAVRREFRRRMVFEAACAVMAALEGRQAPGLYRNIAKRAVDSAEALVDEIERREGR